MTKVVFVGEMYYSDLHVGGGPMPGGGGGSPPGIWGPTDPRPSQPIYHPGHPEHGHPSHPIHSPPYPDQGLPGGGGGGGSGNYPSHPISGGGTPSHPIAGGGGGMPGQLPVFPWKPDQGLPPGGQPVPPDAINPPLPEPPPKYANQTIVAVKHPGQEWQVATYDVGPSQGQPQPTPH